MMNRRKPEILISNDDGIKSPGIQLLATALSRFANVTVVAPEKEQSTMGHALTLHKPVRLYHYGKKGKMDQWAVSGTPADCVFMGIRRLMKRRPDLIVSGINRGANLGNDIFYSGTVAAAREGALLNIPAIAASLMISHNPLDVGGKTYFEDAAQYMAHLAKQVLKNGMPTGCMLNVNYPNLPKRKVKGAVVARQGFRYYSNKAAQRIDPRGKPYYWLGGQYVGFKAIEGSDCVLVDEGYISVTPCRLDVTQYESLDALASWKLYP
jgi:5'-nucleotidase